MPKESFEERVSCNRRIPNIQSFTVTEKNQVRVLNKLLRKGSLCVIRRLDKRNLLKVHHHWCGFQEKIRIKILDETKQRKSEDT